jgi:hypothetical protein
MKIKAFPRIAIVSALVLLSGCASYRASSLDSLSGAMIQSSSSKTNEQIMVSAKAFDPMDCKHYLGRNVLREGYQPVQLFIQNNSDKNYIVSLDRLSLPHAYPEQVAKTVHTSTMARVLGYGIPGVLIAWPLIIPAVLDGIKSSEANDALDMDFHIKSARQEQIVAPRSYFNKLVFVDKNLYQPDFTLTLIEQETKKEELFHIVAG